MKEKIQITFYQCTGCGSKFKKQCTSIVTCPIEEKCKKCGSDMNKIGNPYNKSKSI